MKTQFAKNWIIVGSLALVGTAHAAYGTYDEAIDAARIPFNQGNYAEAQTLAEEALGLAKTPSQEAGALLRIGFTYGKRKMYAQAREQWQKILQLPNVSDGEKIEARFVIATSYSDEKKWDEARAEFQKILVAPGVTSENESTARLAIAVTFFNQGKVEQGRDEMLLVAQNPLYESKLRGPLYAQIGQTFLNSKDFEKARDAFNQALELAGDIPALAIGAYISIAKSYEAEGDDAQAKKEYDKAQGQIFLATAQASMKKDWDAVRNFQETLLTLKNVSPIVDASARLFIGDSFVSQDKPAQAREKFEEFVQTPYPNSPPDQKLGIETMKQSTQLSIARTYIKEGNNAEARNVIEDLLGKDGISAGVTAAAEKLLATLPTK